MKKISLKKFETWFKSLSGRERSLVGATILVVSIWFLGIPVGLLRDYITGTQHLITKRTHDLDELSHLLRRNHTLDQHLKKLQATFQESQMTFEQVTTELDKVVKTSIGNENYDLKKTRPPSPFGLDFEKQDFALNIRSLTLEQLVTLLYNLEQGKRPLFLGKLDLVQAPPTGTFTATLEIFSISKPKA